MNNWHFKAFLLIIVAIIIFFGAIEAQFFIFNKKIQSKFELSEKKKQSEFDQSPSQKDKYSQVFFKIKGKSLILSKLDGQEDVIMPDITSSGIKTEICGQDELYVESRIDENTLLLSEGCGEMGGTLWQFDIPSKSSHKLKYGLIFGPTSDLFFGRYQISLANDEGTQIAITDFKADRRWTLKPLPVGYSYVQQIGDMGGEPIPNFYKPSNNGYIWADVYLADIPFTFFETVKNPVFHHPIFLEPPTE